MSAACRADNTVQTPERALHQEDQQISEMSLTSRPEGRRVTAVPRSRTQRIFERRSTSCRRRGARKGRNSREVNRPARAPDGRKSPRKGAWEPGSSRSNPRPRFLGTLTFRRRPPLLGGGRSCVRGRYQGRYTSLAIGDSHTATSTTRTRGSTTCWSRSQITRAKFSAVGDTSSNGGTALIRTWS